MAKSDVLARVDSDLERGHTHLAIQRLSSLAAADPGDLDIRARLAAVHRATGNLAEAGRWGFLTEDATDAEIAAFERSRRAAWEQVNTLRGVHPSRLGPRASARYLALTERAGAEHGIPVPMTAAEPDTWLDRLFFGLVVTLLGAIPVLAVIGLVTVVRWFL